MAVLERTLKKNTVQVTFVLAADHPCGEVSVVGDFNDWQPGAHPLRARKDGSRSITVAMPTEQRVHFRYLADGGHWFDDDSADGHDGSNSYLQT